MSQPPLTPAAFATARELYARYRDGDPLEFEQEMDGTLPAQMLLCELDAAFAQLAQQLDAIAGQMPRDSAIDPDLEALVAAAYEEIHAAHFRFLKRFVALDTPGTPPG